ncbi:hypothetical protein DFP99_1128 [Weissella soli]|uniref:Uncharacterized protein n=1 Tax=Weissella soli TaxID=155866 RepID=A0A288Q7A1_9LACO|nr:hypothetical protein WSWS_01560 [Weissella soli]RDL06737.1 hypothetical protein DFP99_1128 [Weissella soli]
MIIIRVLIGIYALLMIIASVQSLISEKDTDREFHYINFLISIALIISLIYVSEPYIVIPVSISLIGYQALALYRGVSTHSFHWQHHVVRLIITIILITILLFI